MKITHIAEKINLNQVMDIAEEITCVAENADGYTSYNEGFNNE